MQSPPLPRSLQDALPAASGSRSTGAARAPRSPRFTLSREGRGKFKPLSLDGTRAHLKRSRGWRKGFAPHAACLRNGGPMQRAMRPARVGDKGTLEAKQRVEISPCLIAASIEVPEKQTRQLVRCSEEKGLVWRASARVFPAFSGFLRAPSGTQDRTCSSKEVWPWSVGGWL